MVARDPALVAGNPVPAARDPAADPFHPELAHLLGPARSVRLEQLLHRRAAAWAAEVAPGGVHVALAPAGISTAAERVFAAGRGPLLIMWPELPLWRPEHAAGALGDLADGCDVSVGPVFDGGFYLVALARFVPAVLELPDDGWRGPDAMGRILAVAHEAGLEAGLLRAERALRRPGDVRAAVADPLLDDELRAVLSGS